MSYQSLYDKAYAPYNNDGLSANFLTSHITSQCDVPLIMSGYPNFSNIQSFPYRPRQHGHPQQPMGYELMGYAPSPAPGNNHHSQDHDEIRRKIGELDDRLNGVDELMKRVKRAMEDLSLIHI